MGYENIIYEKKDGIAYIKLNRPKALNALSTLPIIEMDDAMSDFEKDQNVKVAILSGEGKAFAVGADIAAMQDMYLIEGLEYAKLGHDTFRHMEKIRKPIIAAIHRFAMGGRFEITLACDLRIAAADTKFALPEVGLGLTPGFGGTQRLPRLIGETKAKELIYTAKTFDAEEALSLGVLNKVVPLENLMEEAEKLAKTIMSKSTLAVGFVKDAINRGKDLDIDSAVNLENIYVGMCFSTEDFHEGMTAFLEKRKPVFKEK